MSEQYNSQTIGYIRGMTNRYPPGQKFGKLTIITQAPSIPDKNPLSNPLTVWQCQCDCGKIVDVRHTFLARGQTSCGCEAYTIITKIVVGTKINRLTAVKHIGSKWLCQCDCGETTTVDTNAMISGNTKSCGCLSSEKSSLSIQKAIANNRKYPPRITTARRCWKKYCLNDKLCTLTFDEWYDLSQLNCSYCDGVPNTTYNFFLNRKNHPVSANAIQEGYFTYNGVDRIDNSLPHIMGNVCSACWICNAAKSNRTTEEFVRHIMTVRTDRVFVPPKLIQLPTGYLLAAVGSFWNSYRRKNGGIQIDKQALYTYSQLPCFYCGVEKYNHSNRYKNDARMSQEAKDGAEFHYNGIDRIDNSPRHNLQNIVPCCGLCNRIKNDLTFAQFSEWINRIQSFQLAKKTGAQSAIII